MSRIMHYHGDDTADYYICRDEHAEAEHQAKFYLEFDVGTGAWTTSRIQRFETVDQAQHFCDELVKKGDLTDIMRQALIAESAHRKAIREEGRVEFNKFMDKITGLGVSPKDVPDLINAFNNLGDYARLTLVDPHCALDYAAAHPQPEVSKVGPMSLGEYMDMFEIDMDICVVDKDTGEHLTPAICYLAPDELRRGKFSYSDQEEWLRSLPMDKVVNGSGSPCAIVKTDLSSDQVNFLLDCRAGFDDPEKWSVLFDKAEYAEASFTQRLAYLKDGTSFEVPFDGTCMDVQDPKLRQSLCSFLTGHDTAYVMNPHSGHGLAVYATARQADGTLDLEICSAPIARTEPGKGLASTVDGRCYYAEQKARQARDSVMGKEPTKTPSAGKEF